MKPTLVKSHISSIENVMLEKGFYNPTITIYMNWIGRDMAANVSWRVDAHSKEQNEFIYTTYDGGFNDLFDKTWKFVDKMKPIAEARREAFIAAIANLIEQGRDINIDVEFLNPLTDMMKKLSTNILEKQ